MKKIYLSVVLLGLSATSMAQLLSPERVNHVQNDGKVHLNKPVLQNSEDKALGTVIWTDNFDDGSNWTIDNSGQVSPFGWNIGTTVNSWWANFSTGISSTSGGGFAEVNNGDYYADNQAINVVYTMTSNPIDIANLPANTSNSEFVTVQFEQFGGLFNDGQKLQISTDGIAWTDIFTNNDRTTFVGNNPDALYANPEVVRVDIASEIAGNSSSVQFRFEWTSRFASNTATIAWTTFGWFIDDFRLETSSDNDLEAQVPYWGTDGLWYHQIPTTQIAPISFTTRVQNLGTATQNNAILSVDVDGGATFSGTSPLGVNVAPGTTDSLIVSTTYTPAATVGSHTITWGVSQDEVDDVPANNDNASQNLDITTFIYARDKGVAGGTTSNQGEGFESGNLFDIWVDQNLEYVDVVLGTSTQVGALIYVKVYSIDGTTGDFVLEDQSDYYEVLAGDITGGVLTLPLLNGVNLTAANQTYLVTIGSDGDGGATNDLRIATSGVSDPQTTFYYDATDATWYYSTTTPMVRMNFNPFGIGLNEVAAVNGVNVYPNPVKDVVNVEYNLDASSDVTIELVDVTGKVISSEKIANAEGTQTTSFNTEALNGGVYFVNITSDETSITKKFIKK